jgi:hypothetical protein
MDTQSIASRQFAPFDDDADSAVDSWTLDELRRCADLESVQSAMAQTHDWHA